MFRYFLTLSYDGRPYNGWQVQENTPHTVQQVLEEKLSLLLREKINVVGCGRTDTGVNASNYIAHFDCTTDTCATDRKMLFKLNGVLPETISVSSIRRVKPTAHARFDATERVYYYYLSREKNVFRSRYTWFQYGEIDFEKMNNAADLLLKQTDFSCFCKAHTQNKTNVCNVTEARWVSGAGGEWRFIIRADRFLRGMVRAVVGTLLLVGKNKISMEEFKNILQSGDRKLAGSNAPANALFLAGIKYPKDIYID